MPVRSPFLVCSDRHPDAIEAVEKSADRVRTQLVYSRGDTACVLAGLALDDVNEVRRSRGVRFVEPLPHPAKISRSLHAELKPTTNDSRGDGEGHRGRRASTSRSPHSGSEARSPLKEDPQRNIRLIYSDGLPADLEVTLTPGIWGKGAAQRWIGHLDSFESADHLWNEHLRERFFWTRSDQGAPSMAGRRAGRRAGGETTKGSATEPVAASSDENAAEHGLKDTIHLWEHVIRRSSKQGVCDFGRLNASLWVKDDVPPVSDSGKTLRNTSDWEGANGRTRQAGGDGHDRVVLRGADSLGTADEHNDHCLLTTIAYLSTRPEVSRVADLPRVMPMNIEAAWITQSARESTYPVWGEGIDGRTEVRRVRSRLTDPGPCLPPVTPHSTQLDRQGCIPVPAAQLFVLRLERDRRLDSRGSTASSASDPVQFRPCGGLRFV